MRLQDSLGDPNFVGMVEQIIASQGRVFVGTWYSTFTGYINRLRGYYGLRPDTSFYFWEPKKFQVKNLRPKREKEREGGGRQAAQGFFFAERVPVSWRLCPAPRPSFSLELHHACFASPCAKMRDEGTFPAKFTSPYAREWPMAWTDIDDDRRQTAESASEEGGRGGGEWQRGGEAKRRRRRGLRR